jgi:hypothetical protein
MKDYHEGILGFECKRNKYERQDKFRSRYITEERKYFKSLIEKDITIPKGYTQLIYCCDLIEPKLYGHITDWKKTIKNGYKGVYKKVKVRFELE